MNNNDWHPGKLLEMSGNYWKACTIHTGVKLDIFSVIAHKELIAEEIAKKINGEPRGVKMLLNALSAMKLLEKKGDTYANTKAAASFLSKSSPKYIGHMIMHHHHLVEGWANLDQAVITGSPVRERVSHAPEETRESFIMGMFAIAMSIAPGLAEKIDLSNRRCLLDLGGGPGTYAIHFCLKNPGLKADIFDLPTTRPFAEKTVAKFGLSDRIDFQAGSFIDDEIESTYDVVWLSHILHGEGPEDCCKIIKKAVSALETDGMIMIHEFILDNTMDGPLFPAIFSLNMLLGTPNGQSYSEAQLMEMLQKAGVKDIRRLDFKGPTESGIITGIKKQ